MAALIPARPGNRVLEAGCGAGAGLLCLKARVENLAVTGFEIDPATAALARINLIFNACNDTEIVTNDICNAGQILRDTPETPPFRFDHIFANPPWHQENATASPEPRRDKARRARKDTLHRWISTFAGLLREKGSLTLAIPSTRLAETLAACEKVRIGSAEIIPLWPHEGEESRIVLIRARRGGQAGSRILPGLVLHKDDGSFTPAAEAILRNGQPLFPESFRSPRRVSGHQKEL
ncbi:methyltransferase [Acetobacter sicerae]|uniref:Methyltransferase n=1 Tax=Acetobacter sicerae TaxID=85325 RepID=A0ABS8VVC2_9PROT|nr:methyltransferase [Acetobacter sicerae]MCE0742852.1 methyltransferase [Acetobacter sicerae]